MGIFSSSPPLSPEMKAIINVFFSEEFGVSKRDVKTGFSKVEGSRLAIESALAGGEEILTIVPSIAQNTGYDCLIVVTTHRILAFKGSKIRKQMRRGDVADIEKRVTPSGDFLVNIVSSKAAPFASFAGSSLNNNATMKYWEGTIMVHALTEDLMNGLLQSISV